MILPNNNNQGVFLELLVAVNNSSVGFMQIEYTANTVKEILVVKDLNIVNIEWLLCLPL